MHNELIREIVESINTHHRILLTAHHRLDADSAGAMLALYDVLRAMGKDPHAVTMNPIPKDLQFLPGIGAIENPTNEQRDFVISLFNPDTKVHEVKYTTSEHGLLSIIITPKKGTYSAQDVRISNGDFDYDLIIIVDCGDSKNIGELYTNHKDAFEKAVVINIDHHVSNDHFGDINLVDTKASSACELVHGVITALGDRFITPDVATCLLTGIIADTGSFKHGNTTAKSLEISAELMEKGARQQDIIINLFKMKPYARLRIWGRILSKMQLDAQHGILWSQVSAKDLEQYGATPDDVHGVLDELLTTYPKARYFLLFTETSDTSVKVSVRTREGVDGEHICVKFGGGGHREACGFTTSETLETITKNVLEYIRESGATHTLTPPPISKQGDHTTHIAKKLEGMFFGQN